MLLMAMLQMMNAAKTINKIYLNWRFKEINIRIWSSMFDVSQIHGTFMLLENGCTSNRDGEIFVEVYVTVSMSCWSTVYMYHLSIDAKQNKPIRFSSAKCQSLNGLFFLWCKNWIGFIFYRFIASIFYMIVQSEFVFSFRSTVIVANPFCFPLIFIFIFDSHFACLHFNGHLSTNTHINGK